MRSTKQKLLYNPNDPLIRGCDSPDMSAADALKLSMSLGTEIEIEEGKAVLVDVMPLKGGGYKLICRLFSDGVL
jgi:hypothetical protein